MSECERCQERLVEQLSGELDDSDGRAVLDHLADCETCSHLTARLRTGMTLVARLEMEEPPEAVTQAVMKTARERCGDEPAATTFSTAMLSLPRSGWLSRVRVVVTRPQFVMGTVMVLAVVFGAWYVPRRAAIHSVGGGAPTLAPAELESEPLSPSGVGVPSMPSVGPELGTEALDGRTPAESTEARLERGLQAFGRSDYVGAIDELNAVASSSDVSEDAWLTATHHLARSYTRNGDCESATRRYEQLFGRSPTYNHTHAAMVEAGACYRALGNELRARELLEVAVQDPATAAAARAELDLLRMPPHGRRRLPIEGPGRDEDRPPPTIGADPEP